MEGPRGNKEVLSIVMLAEQTLKQRKAAEGKKGFLKKERPTPLLYNMSMNIAVFLEDVWLIRKLSSQKKNLEFKAFQKEREIILKDRGSIGASTTAIHCSII
uniref:Uncharacterized protein n=1 Tax=Steinernema glaseri TaxID=37863 RepID=A0A1I7ZD81_9BILA